MAKKLLPWFGGTPTVWLSNVFFFQTALLLGYLYVFLLTKLPRLKTQAYIHLGLLCGSLLFLPLAPPETTLTGTLPQPLQIGLLLGATLLVPAILMSSTSPLCQYWYAQCYLTPFPYRYYALSNLGSLLGLLSFPFLIEPLMGLKTQQKGWTLGYLLFFLVSGIAALHTARIPHTLSLRSPAEATQRKTPWGLWLLLPALSTALLLNATQWMMQNLSGFPLLWVLPLACYLLSFMITFYHKACYVRSLIFPLYIASAAALLYTPSIHAFSLKIQLPLYSALIFTGTFLCHGELFRLQPSKARLPLFYLFIAIGGALGSCFVNLLSPFLLQNWWDFYGTLLGIPLIVGFLLHTSTPPKTAAFSVGCCLISMIVLAVFLRNHLQEVNKEVIYSYRNSFGKGDIVEKHTPPQGLYRTLKNGQILHGHQFLEDTWRRTPTTYYGPKSGVALSFTFLRSHTVPLRVGIIGLGTGTLAALGEKGDHFCFYEIDPTIIRIAQRYFFYLKDTPATIDIIRQDGRLALAKQLEQASEQYDLFIIDAFHGDAIPLHLLTQEALALYLAHLKPNGIIAFHISNRYIDLYPPLQALASAAKINAYLTYQPGEVTHWLTGTEWLLMSHHPTLGHFLFESQALSFRSQRTEQVWTDDRNYLLPSIRW